MNQDKMRDLESTVAGIDRQRRAAGLQELESVLEQIEQLRRIAGMRARLSMCINEPIQVDASGRSVCMDKLLDDYERDRFIQLREKALRLLESTPIGAPLKQAAPAPEPVVQSKALEPEPVREPTESKMRQVKDQLDADAAFLAGGD